MEADRWTSANESPSDSWKQLMEPTIAPDLKQATEIYLNAKHVCTRRAVIVWLRQKHPPTHFIYECRK